MVKVNIQGVSLVLLAFSGVACDSSMNENDATGNPLSTVTSVSNSSDQIDTTVETAAGSSVIVDADADEVEVEVENADEVENTATATATDVDAVENADVDVEAVENADADADADSGSVMGNADTSSNTQESADAASGSGNSVQSVSSDAQHSNGGNGASASVTSSASLDLSANPGAGMHLIADVENNQCVEVGEVFDLNVSGILVEPDTEYSEINLTSYSTLVLESHSNLQVVSHSDESISVSMTSPDILDLTVQYENEFDLIYVSAVNAETSKPLILIKKYGADNCSFALYTDTGCAVIAPGVGEVSASVNGTSITAKGCVLNNPQGISVIDLE